jgi:tetratricopeptide (TPR) repeat protein
MIAGWILLFALQVTPELQRHIESGLRAKSAGDFDTAVQEFTHVAELAPGLAAAHVNLGAVYLQKKDYAKAARSLRQALEIDPGLPGAHAMLGAALLAQGYAQDAIPHLEKGQADDLLGVGLLEADRPRDAVDHLEAALGKRTGDPDLLYYLAQAHDRLAKQVFEQLRQSSPDSPRTHQALGEVLVAGGKTAEAEQHFRTALAARADLRDVHYALGELYLESGDYQKAEPEFRAEARLSPGSAAAAYKLGLVLASLGRTTEAIVEFRRADALQPGVPETLIELGKALNASGDAASAEPLLQRAVSTVQAGDLAASAHFQLANVYRKLGRMADADREMKAFQQLRARERK